jgi:hypothetical protein
MAAPVNSLVRAVPASMLVSVVVTVAFPRTVMLVSPEKSSRSIVAAAVVLNVRVSTFETSYDSVALIVARRESVPSPPSTT